MRRLALALTLLACRGGEPKTVEGSRTPFS